MNDDQGQTSALDRGLAMLEFLATARESSTAEIAAGVGLSRSTTYRLVERLAGAGFLERTSPAGRWRLGAAAARLGAAAAQSSDVAQVAPDLLRVLVQQTRETVGLGVPGTDEMVFIYRERGPQAVAVNPPLGARRPLHCTSIGKAYLASLPLAEAHDVVRRIDLTRFTDHTLTSVTDLETDLAETRRRGWSVDRREFEPSVTCCGAAVRDHTGMPVAAISASGPTRRTTPLLDRLGPVVQSTADAISRRLGYAPED